VVSVILIHVLNMKLTCEWQEAIKLNYKRTHTHVIVVLRVSKHYTWHITGRHWCNTTPHSRANIDKTCQLTGTVCGPTRKPHFSLAIISITVQLCAQMFWVISVYFTIRNTLLKCHIPPGTPCMCVCNDLSNTAQKALETMWQFLYLMRNIP
jgi:hypothetical protein